MTKFEIDCCDGGKTGHLVLPKLFASKVHACLGCAAKYRIVLAIAMYPAKRNMESAVLRNAAMTAGMSGLGKHPA